MDKDKEIEKMENEGSPVPADDSNYDNQLEKPKPYHDWIREKIDKHYGDLRDVKIHDYEIWRNERSDEPQTDLHKRMQSGGPGQVEKHYDDNDNGC